MFFSSANHLFLARKNGSVVYVSKFQNLDNVFTTFKIKKKKNEYSIHLGDEYLCEENGKITLCDKENYWRIRPATFGYTISKNNNKCITAKPNSKLALQRCRNMDEQIVDFKFSAENTDCDQKDEEKDDALPKEIILKLDPEITKKVSSSDCNPTVADYIHEKKSEPAYSIKNEPVYTIKSLPFCSLKSEPFCSIKSEPVYSYRTDSFPVQVNQQSKLRNGLPFI